MYRNCDTPGDYYIDRHDMRDTQKVQKPRDILRFVILIKFEQSNRAQESEDNSDIWKPRVANLFF